MQELTQTSKKELIQPNKKNLAAIQQLQAKINSHPTQHLSSESNNTDVNFKGK
ncbi:hypothetical protein RBV54_004908 [Salmonella enterica]|nr:hypothetical protein [Salmonella enterica]ELF7042537.1 hypothetical protein [Salmonella enterica]